MIDTFVKVYKQKEDGNLLKGAQLTVVSTKTKIELINGLQDNIFLYINDVMKKKLLKGIYVKVKMKKVLNIKLFPN